MGRKCGYLELIAGIAGGAEGIVIPEFETTPEQVAEAIHDAYQRGKAHAIIVVAEGAQYNANKLSDYFTRGGQHLGFDVRATTLGHIQRGGAPGVSDRLLASRL